MFDIGLFEFMTLAVIALLVFGPDRLPKVTAQATHWLRQIREQAQSARQQITESIDVDSTMLKDLADLHPRNIAKAVMEPVDEAKAMATDATSETRTTSSPAQPGAPATEPAAAPKPMFDPDAT